MPRHVGSKWRKTFALTGDKRLRQHVPKTVMFSSPQLFNMLKEFGMVYVKPDTGTAGLGVMRVEKVKGGYRFQHGQVVRSYVSFDRMCVAIKKEMKGRRYLIQRGIHLLTHGGRRFDIRVMVQMNPQKKWETTGQIGRLAAPNKIVTNYHNGGTPLPVPQLLKSHLNKVQITQQMNKLRQLGLDTAKIMQTRFPGVCEIGVDVGIDKQLNLWIIEVNTSPDPFIFRRLPDPAIFSKIKRYAQAYGRFKKTPIKTRAT